ncbi:MAG: type II toxin-antitoxin system VapC family toxin [Candidatus Bathycorpusculaceae bacterium]
MRVIDASALSAYILREEGFEEIRNFITEGVVSVELVLKEVANAILITHRRGGIKLEDMKKSFEALLSLLGVNVKTVGQEGLLREAFDIALKQDTTIYDALYIALARKNKAELISRDEKQAKKAEEAGVEVLYR